MDCSPEGNHQTRLRRGETPGQRGFARRPVARLQEFTTAEKARPFIWMDWTQQFLASKLKPPPDAFNLGITDGPAAGQSMLQLYFHVIPRYTGDVPSLVVASVTFQAANRQVTETANE